MKYKIKIIVDDGGFFGKNYGLKELIIESDLNSEKIVSLIIEKIKSGIVNKRGELK